MADSDSDDSEIPTVKDNVIIKTTVERRASNRRTSRTPSFNPHKKLVPVIVNIPSEITDSLLDASAIQEKLSSAGPTEEGPPPGATNRVHRCSVAEHAAVYQAARKGSIAIPLPRPLFPGERSSTVLERIPSSSLVHEPEEHDSNLVTSEQERENQSSGPVSMKQEPEEHDSSLVSPNQEREDQRSGPVSPPQQEQSGGPELVSPPILKDPKSPELDESSEEKRTKKTMFFVEPSRDDAQSHSDDPKAYMRRATPYPKEANKPLSGGQSRDSSITVSGRAGERRASTSSSFKPRASIKPSVSSTRKASLMASKERKSSTSAKNTPEEIENSESKTSKMEKK